MTFKFNTVARNPTSALIVGGIFLSLVGALMDEDVLIGIGILALVAGIFLQVGYLQSRYR